MIEQSTMHHRRRGGDHDKRDKDIYNEDRRPRIRLSVELKGGSRLCIYVMMYAKRNHRVELVLMLQLIL